ncbi:MAG: TonB-dependent receptor [Candidatus Zixiibacteriota bacterium]
MIKKTLIRILWFVLLISISIGANITGKVTDLISGKPIKDVNILLEVSGLGDASDADGKFRIDEIPSGEYTLIASHVGYQKYTKKLNLKQDDEIKIEIEMMPSSVMSDAIVTTATRRPALLKNVPEIVMVTTEEELRNISPIMVTDAVQYVPGVSIEAGTGSGQPFKKNITIDGLPSQYNLIMMDDSRIVSSHWHTGANVNIIPPEHIESIEIVKGAASAQYGSDGMGGVLNIKTKKNAQKPKLLYSAYGGDQNTFITNLSYQSPVNDNVSQSSFVGWEQSDGAKIIAPAFRLGDFNYNRFTMMNRVDAKITEKIDLGAQIFYLNSIYPYKSEDNYESWLYTPKMDIAFRPNENIDINASAYYTDWESERNEEINQISEPELSVGYKGIKDNYLLIGGQYKYHNFQRKAVPEADQTSMGFYLQDEWKGLDQFAILAALRYDKTKEVDAVISPKLTVKYHPTDNIALRVSGGRGFRAPSVQDLNETLYGHSWSDHYRAGNPGLQPEYSTSLTGGIETDIIDGLTLIANGYYSSITDMITPVDHGLENPLDYFDIEQIPGHLIDSTGNIDSIYIYQRQNIHEAIIYGGELKLSWNFYGGLYLDGSYNYTHNENKDTEESLPYYPGSTIGAKLHGSQDINDWLALRGFLGLNMVAERKIWEFKHEGDEPQQEELEDYQKLDGGLSFVLDNKYELFFRADNILGQEITTYEDVIMTLEGVPTIIGGLRINIE